MSLTQNVLGSTLQQWDVSVLIAVEPIADAPGARTIPNTRQGAAFLEPRVPARLQIDYNERWPSSYADHGYVNWTITTSQDGDLRISFPDVRWTELRRSEGWAALQHHAVLRTTIAVDTTDGLPELAVELSQGSYFALRPQSADIASFVPRWYPGNIYAMERPLPMVVPLPFSNSKDGEASYDLFISGDYEIRLFGDPTVEGQAVPEQRITVRIGVQPRTSVLHQPTQDVLCDFVDGFAFGSALGVGLHSSTDWWRVTHITQTSAQEAVQLRLKRTIRLAKGQTRLLPLEISQTTSFFGDGITLDIHLESAQGTQILPITLPVKHWEGPRAIRASFFFANSTPSIFCAIPPPDNTTTPSIPIVALHGAGVDILFLDFWMQALPKNNHGWVVIPIGRTSWGLDWHGPSTDDVFASVAALEQIVGVRKAESWSIPSQDKIVLIGHSNGGQGTWYIASRYPDRIFAAVPAAGYIKSQAYIPLTLSRGAHFVDPSLRAILESSLTPDDNDLHVTNLAQTQVLAIHGGEDSNVPTWHSRELMSTLKSWYPDSQASFLENPGEGHWYSYVLSQDPVKKFVEEATNPNSASSKRIENFTLTVSDPLASGPLNGWKIERLAITGRLGRLQVSLVGSVVEVATVNAVALSLDTGRWSQSSTNISIDGTSFSVPTESQTVYFTRPNTHSEWKTQVQPVARPAPSRIQAILSSNEPLVIITSTIEEKHATSIALRFAHALYIYHRLDAEIITEQEALQRTEEKGWSSGNIVFIGSPRSQFAIQTVERGPTPIILAGGVVRIGDKTFKAREQATLFLHPHPASEDAGSCVLFILSDYPAGLERAARLFPFRTGVPVPSWIVLSSAMDTFGIGGIVGAGVWSSDWGLNEPMSWF